MSLAMQLPVPTPGESIKRSRIDVSASHVVGASSPNHFRRIPGIIITEIFSHLDIMDFFSFEKTFQTRNLTESTWIYFRKRDYFEFDWTDCENERYRLQKNRYNYILGAATIKFFSTKHLMGNVLEHIEKFEKRFKKLGELFPHFGYYIDREFLYRKTHYLTPNWEMEKSISEAEKSHGGEILLRILLLLQQSEDDKKNRIDLLGQYVAKAMVERKVTLITGLSVWNELSISIQKPLTLVAAHYKNFTALEKDVVFLSTSELEDLLKDHRLGPILHQLATKIEDKHKRLPLIEEALRDYNYKDNLKIDRTPLSLLECAAHQQTLIYRTTLWQNRFMTEQ